MASGRSEHQGLLLLDALSHASECLGVLVTARRGADWDAGFV